MIELRKQGMTYKQIEDALGVSHWATIHYLSNIKIERGIIEEAWREAENKAKDFLETLGFTDIHNLNRFVSLSYWDVLARKGKEWWLIDVTISEGKKLGAKIPQFVEGYVHAVLYRDIITKKWRLVKLSYEDVG